MDIGDAINAVSFIGGIIVAVVCTLLTIWKWKVTVDNDIRANRKAINEISEKIDCLRRKNNDQHQEFMAEMREEFAKIWEKLSDIDRRVAHIEGKLDAEHK